MKNAAFDKDELLIQLAASQAHNLRLRSALDQLLEYTDPKTHTCFCECDPSVGYQCSVCSWATLPEVAQALEALREPTDTEALEKYVMERLGEPVAYWYREGEGDETMFGHPDGYYPSNAVPLFALKEPK